MSFYTGSTPDASDMRLTGFYLSPNGQEASNMPYYNREHELYWRVYDHISGKRTFRDEYHLVLQKTSTLSRACRDWLVEQFENNKTAGD